MLSRSHDKNYNIGFCASCKDQLLVTGENEPCRLLFDNPQVNVVNSPQNLSPLACSQQSSEPQSLVVNSPRNLRPRSNLKDNYAWYPVFAKFQGFSSARKCLVTISIFYTITCKYAEKKKL